MTQHQPWSAAAARGRRIGHAVEFHAQLPSTNDRARDALAEPDGEGRAVIADLQTAGRGRRGRTWLSPAGVNLLFSVAIRPRLAADHAWWLGAAAGLAVVEATRRWTIEPLRLKWPNDVVTADGHKVAGLLLETAVSGDRLSEAVIGIGLNANWRRSQMPDELAATATSLADLAGSELDRAALLSALLDALDAEVSAVEAGTRPTDRYRAASVLDGRAVLVAAGERQISGVARGIDEDGALLVEGPMATTAVPFGEVISVRESLEVHG